MTKKNNRERKDISPTFQIILMIISTLLIAYGLSFAAKTYYSLDSLPAHSFSSSPLNAVQTTLTIQDIIKPDLNKGSTSFDILLTFEYNNAISSSPSLSNFFFKYSFVREKNLLAQSKTGSKTTETWRVIVECFFDLAYQLFPINDHLLTLHLYYADPSLTLTCAPNGLILPLKREFNGWHVVSEKSSLTSHQIQLASSHKPLSEISCSLALNKVGYRGSLSIFLPLCIILFIALFTLSLPQGSALNLVISLLLALNAFRIVLEKLSPKTSYLLFSDLLFIFVLITTFIIFIIHAIPDRLSKGACYILLVSTHLFLILLFYSYLRVWI